MDLEEETLNDNLIHEINWNPIEKIFCKFEI